MLVVVAVAVVAVVVAIVDSTGEMFSTRNSNMSRSNSCCSSCCSRRCNGGRSQSTSVVAARVVGAIIAITKGIAIVLDSRLPLILW